MNDLVNNNKAFEGIKNGAVEFVSGVKNGAIFFVNGLLRPNRIEDRLVFEGVPSDLKVPWNVLDNKAIQDHIIAPLKMLFRKMLFSKKNGEKEINEKINVGVGKVPEENNKETKTPNPPVQIIENYFPNDVQNGKRFDYTIENGRLKRINGVNEVDFVIDIEGNLHIGRGHSYLGEWRTCSSCGEIENKWSREN